MKAHLIKRFEGEVEGLERELKIELPKEIKRAREHGDLSENAEYHAAKERQRYLEARIGMLRRRIGDIQLMNLDKLPRDKVGLGSIVHLKEQGGDAIVYKLVLPEDAEPAKGLISPSSPIGRALLNKEAGDEVSVPTPGGVRHFELVKLVTVFDDV